MDKYNFIKLLHKYLNGEATEDERNFLINYYNLFHNEPDIIALMSDEKRALVKEEIKDAVWEIIAKDEQLNQKSRNIRLWRNRILIAAIFVMICSVGIVYRLSLSKNQLADKTQTITIVNNQHTERLIHLPDNSTLILGAGSKVHYLSSFRNLAKREVYLEGNAFFDVVSNPSQPFIVYSGKLQTTVLGTAFTVEAFPWEKDITVTVKRGKVKVTDSLKTQGIITPNQQIKYNIVKSVSTQNLVDADNYNKWKEANLTFDDVTFAQAAEVLEQKYNVRISFSDEKIKSKHFTATLSVDESLEFILRTMCEFNEAVFSSDKSGKTILIDSQKPFKSQNLN